MLRRRSGHLLQRLTSRDVGSLDVPSGVPFAPAAVRGENSRASGYCCLRVSSTPYPHPTSSAVTAVMKGNRKRGTKPELALRSALHRAGARFRCDYPVKTARPRSIRVDVAFPRAGVAVFVDGCFWHRCPEHGVTPRSNTAYWQPKLDRNVARDAAVDRALHDAGWAVVRVWEHEAPATAAERVLKVIRRHR
jgi:DNA mismatch endonuclease (patch repair protein)